MHTMFESVVLGQFDFECRDQRAMDLRFDYDETAEIVNRTD